MWSCSRNAGNDEPGARNKAAVTRPNFLLPVASDVRPVFSPLVGHALEVGCEFGAAFPVPRSLFPAFP